MGKINEYQRKQLASSAVGAAAPDQSGQIIGGTVSKLGAAMAAKEKELDMYNEIQANTAVMQFGLSFQQFGAQAQREMAANPGKYAERLFAGGQEMLTSFAEGIQDAGVRAKFITGANTILKAGVRQAPIWSDAKKKDNAKIAAEDAIRLGTVITGQAIDKEQLVTNIATVKAMAAAEIPETVLSKHDANTFIDKNMSGVLDSYFVNQVRENPQQTMDDIKADKYNDVEYFTEKMGDKYIGLAESRIKQVKAENIRRQTENFGILTLDALDGNLDTTKVDAFWSRRESDPANSITTGQKGRLLKGLITRVNLEAGKTKAAHSGSRKYIDLVYSTFDNRVDQAVALEQVIDVWVDNYTSPDELKFLSQLKANLQEYQTSQQADNWYKSARTVTDKVQRLWLDRRGDDKEADALKELVAGASAGVPAETAARGVLNRLDREKATEENPLLSGYEDPVAQAYNQKAEEMLKEGGYKVDAKRIEALAASLRAENDRTD